MDKVKNKKIELAYIGCVVAEDESSEYNSFSPAANKLQTELLDSLVQNKLAPSIILSGRPVKSYPKTPKIFFKNSQRTLKNRMTVQYVSFINHHVLKILTLSVNVLLKLIKWGRATRNCPKAVLCYNLNFPHAVFVLAASRLIGARAIAFIADIMVPGHGIPDTLLRRLDFNLQKWSLKRFDAIIITTKAMRDDFAPDMPYIKIEGGIGDNELDMIRMSNNTKGGSKKKFTIAYAGSLDNIRGTALILEAFKLLHGDEYELIICGKGPLEDTVRSAAKNDKRIKYNGFLQNPVEVYKLYSEADVLLSIYRKDFLSAKYLFPSKIFEYIAAGKPLIVNDLPCFNDYGDIVYKLEDEDAESLSKTIRLVKNTDSSKIKTMSDIAQRRLFNEKRWSVQGRKIAEFLLNIN